MAFDKIQSLRLLIAILTIFSIATVSALETGSQEQPSLSLPLKVPQVGPCGPGPQACACANSQGSPGYCWLPAGPSVDTEVGSIFNDQTAEFADIQSSTPHIDLTDAPLPPSQIYAFTNSSQLATTFSTADHGYMEIEFDLANNFWGCNFQFGNSNCGIQIRQGISHLIDKSIFVATDPSLAGQASAIDNPLPTSNGGLLSPNPCAWDSTFPESSGNCVVGGTGGTAFHLGPAATGANGFPWLEAPGSADLNAAAQHLVIAGLATAFNPATSVLIGVNSAASSNPVNFFIRNDDLARLDLGDGIADEICYLFTGSYTTPCGYLTVTRGPPTAICLYSYCCTPFDVCGPSGGFGMYTARYSDTYPFDSSLYYAYNSEFVNGLPSIQQPTGPCSPRSVPTNTPGDFVYLCNSNYDTVSSEMEFANCLSVSTDPVKGSTNNNSTGTCPTGGLSAFGAGIRAEDLFGKGAYTIPVFETTLQFGYLNSGWNGVVNSDGRGMPNFFTWLNAWNPSPSTPGTLRQGFSETTNSVSPFIESTARDGYIDRSIFDSLAVTNPLSTGQLIDWMALSIMQLSNLSLTYMPPAGTTATFRFTLRPDLFFHDGRRVTSFDVAFSYLSLRGTGAFSGIGAAPMTGVTILGPSQFDINVNAVGPFTLSDLTSLPILPGAYWSNAGSSAWTSSISTCTAMGATCYPAQYNINSATPTTTVCALNCTFPASNMNVNIASTGAYYDPITAHTLVGSGPFTCGTVTSSGSGNCSSSGTMNPPVGASYTLTRFGKGMIPASSLSSIYFRSSGSLALWIWSETNGDLAHDFLTFAFIASCYGLPINLAGACGHWQQGIGANGGPTIVGINQVSIVNRFMATNWVAPYNWSTSPPLGIVAFAPVLHEGSLTLNPASVAGCGAAYPAGGYDC